MVFYLNTLKFLKLSGAPVNISVSKYLLDWNDETRAASKPQKLVESFLFPYWQNDYVLVEFRIPGSKLRIDLLNTSKKIAIEVSPASSHSYNPFFHKGEKLNFLASFKRDEAKREWIEKNNYQFVELNDNHLKDLSAELFIKEFNILL